MSITAARGPRRAVRPMTAAEKAFIAPGRAAGAFPTGSAASGNTKLAAGLDELAALRAAHGDQALTAALERAVAFRRWRAADVRSILAAGAGIPQPCPGRGHPDHRAPQGPSPPAAGLQDQGRVVTAATAPAQAAGLDAGLRRLTPGILRRMAAELIATAKTQRWSPEEFLRTLLDAGITSRDESSTRARMKAAAFPVLKTIGELDVTASPIPQATFDYLASYRGLAGNSVGRVIENLLRLLRNDLVIIDEVGFAARRHRHPAAVPVRRRLRAPRPRDRLSLALRPVGPVPARAQQPAPASRGRRSHRRRIVPDAPGPDQDGRTPH
jgi:hypothetical protein